MFGIGSTEFLVIIVVAVLVLGPEHLPRVVRTFAKVMSDFRRVSTDFQRTMNLEANKEEWREQQQTVKKKKKKKTAPPSRPAAAEGGAPETAVTPERPGSSGEAEMDAPSDSLADAGKADGKEAGV